eukprot:RCo019518
MAERPSTEVAVSSPLLAQALQSGSMAPPPRETQPLVDLEDLSRTESRMYIPGEPPRQEVVWVTAALFMGYAVLVSFQHKVKEALHIDDRNAWATGVFTAGVSCLYLGNLIFRLAHTVIFAWVTPFNRVYISLGSMLISVLLLGVGVFLCNVRAVEVVFLAYLLGGVAVGSFESNLLSAITPLGHTTKIWAIVGIPVGFGMVLIGGFALTATHRNPALVYLIIALMLCLGACVYRMLPEYDIPDNSSTLGAFVTNLEEYSEWGPRIWKHSLALLLDMFCVALFSGLLLYIFDGSKVPMLGRSVQDRLLVPHDWYFVGYNLFSLLGDSLGRKLAYVIHPRNPLIYLLLSVAGALLYTLEMGIAAPVANFLVFLANGLIYGTSTKHIDMALEGRHNLVALSVWLFVGDMGSLTGSLMLPTVRRWFCSQPSLYICA